MRIPLLPVLMLPALAACAGGDSPRQPNESAVTCIHRLYDYPARSMPFQTAVNACSDGHPVNLTGDRYYQVLASSLNVPYVTHDPKRDSTIMLTGSRIPQSTSEPVAPQLELR